MTPDQISEYGVGIVAISLFVWFIRGTLQNVLKRQSASTKGEETLTEQLTGQIEDLHKRNTELTDRYHVAMTDAVKLATTHGEKLMRAVMDVRREHHESMRRVYERLEQTEGMLTACEDRDKQRRERMDRLEKQLEAVVSHPQHRTGV